jgi:hypothetical protein
MAFQEDQSSPPPRAEKKPALHIAPVFDAGEAILLRAKQISQELEERVRLMLQDEQTGRRDGQC